MEIRVARGEELKGELEEGEGGKEKGRCTVGLEDKKEVVEGREGKRREGKGDGRREKGEGREEGEGRREGRGTSKASTGSPTGHCSKRWYISCTAYLSTTEIKKP
jgi:hypothetical protein